MYQGDIVAAQILYFKFTTVSATTGAPATLSGAPALSVYKDNSTTESTSGITLTVDFDGRTGYNHVAIDTSSDGTFYAAGHDFQVVITTGAVGSVSAVGFIVGEFSIANRSALRPATAGRTLVVDAAGLADANVVKVGPTGSGTAQTAGDIIGDTNDIQTRLPAALVSGRIDSSVGAVAANAITAASIATDAIDGDAIAASAVTEIQTGLATATALATAQTGITDLLKTLIFKGTVTAVSISGQTIAINLDSGASTVDNLYAGELLVFTNGTAVGVSRVIESYDGTTREAAFSERPVSPDPTIGDAVAVFAYAGVRMNSGLEVFAAVVTGNVSGDVSGKVLGGGVSSLTGVGVQADARQWVGGTIPAPTVTGVPKVDIIDWLGQTVTSGSPGIPNVNAQYYNTKTTQTDANNLPKVDVEDWNATAVSTPATAGIPEVDIKNINNVSTSSVTAINANQGTTQPINFTGAGASALVKDDVTDWAGVAVSSGSPGIPNVNVKYYNTKTTLTDTNNLPKVDVEDWLGVPATSGSAGIVDVNVKYWNSGSVAMPVMSGFPQTDTVGWRNSTPDALSSGKIPADLKLWLTTAPLALSSQLVQAIVADYASGKVPLQPTTAGRTLDVTATGAAGIDWGNVENQSTQVTLSDTLVNEVSDVANVQVLGSAAINSTSFDVDAITSTALATSAVDEIVDQVWDELLSGHLGAGSTGQKLNTTGSSTFAGGAVSSVTGDVNGKVLGGGSSVITGIGAMVDVEQWNAVAVTSGSPGIPNINVKYYNTKTALTDANNLPEVDVEDWKGAVAVAMTGDSFARLGAPAGASVSSDIAGVQADTDNIQTRIPAALVSGRIDASVGAMAANVLTDTAIATDAITAAKIAQDAIGASEFSQAAADKVWDTTLANHLTAGSTGYALNAASSAGDPWATAIPGSYTSGQAGNIVGNNLDVVVSTRAATGDAMTLTTGERTSIADAILKRDWTAVTGEASRSVLNALRFLRNLWSISGSTLTVTKEDDATPAFTATLTTTPGADPVTGSDPT